MNRSVKLLCVAVLCVLGASILIPFVLSLITLESQVDVDWPSPRALAVIAVVLLLALEAWRRLDGPLWWVRERRRNPRADDLDVLVGRLERAAHEASVLAATADSIGIGGWRVRRVRRWALRAGTAIARLRWVRQHIDEQPSAADPDAMEETLAWRSDALRAGWRTLRRTQTAIRDANGGGAGERHSPN